MNRPELADLQVMEVEAQTPSSFVCSLLLTSGEHLVCSPLQKAEELLVLGFFFLFIDF